MGNRVSFKLIPRMITANVCEIVFALPDGQTKVITQIMFPADGQMNDNLEAAQGVCDILRKRIRKSLAC